MCLSRIFGYVFDQTTHAHIGQNMKWWETTSYLAKRTNRPISMETSIAITFKPKKANAKPAKLNNKRHNPKFRCEFGRVTVVYSVGWLNE